MDTVWLAALLGATVVCTLRGAAARPQGPQGPSAPSGPGPGAAPMAPAPFTAPLPGPGALPALPGPPGLPSDGPAPAFVPILQQQFEQAPDGQYRWSYAAADGTAQEATGELTASRAIAVQGSYSYPSPEGQVQVKYVADEYGFQPTGAHIHPAILEAVRRQVEQARAEPPNLYNDAGFPTGQIGQQGQGLGLGASPTNAGVGVGPPLPLPPPLTSAPSGSALL